MLPAQIKAKNPSIMTASPNNMGNTFKSYGNRIAVY